MGSKNMDAEIKVEFDSSSSRLSLDSGDNLPSLFGKIKKWLLDLKPVCFSGNADTVNEHTVLSDVPENAVFTDRTNSDYDAAGNPVVLDGLQEGVPFSKITISGDIAGKNIVIRSCGENILSFSSHKETETISGITFTRSDDGTITANGTATAVSQYLSTTVEMINGETYTLMGCPSGGSASGFSITDQVTASITDLGSGNTFTYSDAVTPRFKIRIAKGYTCNNVVFRPVLCVGKASSLTVTPTGENYDISDIIRQTDGVNTVLASDGNLTVTGVLKNAAIKRIWDRLYELTASTAQTTDIDGG